MLVGELIEKICHDGSRRKLWALIADLFGVRLPHQSYTPGHSSPLGFVADAMFNPAQDLASWSCRSGGKTLCSSIIAALEFQRRRGLQARVLSGSEDQARYLYEYWRNWCNGPLRGLLDGPASRMLTRINGGRFEILAASQKRVRGLKVQHLYEDELDEIDPEIHAASLGMIATTPSAPGRTIYTSTWHRPQGLMGKMVAACPGNGVRLHKWAIWEAIGNCPVERHDNGRNCPTCPISKPCMEKAREINRAAIVGLASRTNGIYQVEDVIKAFQKADGITWEAEYLCKRPSLGGLVYSMFDRAVHVRPGLDFDNALPTYRAIDFGLNNFVCLWIQEAKDGSIYVLDEYWAQNAVLETNAKYIRSLDEDAGHGVEATFVDPAGRSRNDQTGYSDVKILRSTGIACQYSLTPFAREVRNGIKLVRAALMSASGRPRLFIAAKCKHLITAFESYRLRQVNGEYVDDPIKPQDCDHWMDALRYYFVNRYVPTRVSSGYLRYT